MKKFLRMGVVTALLVVMASPFAVAEEEKEKGALALSNFSATTTITTDYVFRGISQTDGNPAVQGSMDYTHPLGFYLGVWGSNVYKDISDGNLEMDFYGGWTKEFMGVNLDLGGVYYYYPGHSGDQDPTFYETHLGLSYTISGGKVEPTFSVGWNWSPDFFGHDGTGNYFNGSISLALPYQLSVSGEGGYQDVSGDDLTGHGNGLNGGSGYDYWNWRFGVGYSILGFDLDLSYHDTNEADFLGDSIADQRVVFSVSRSF